MEIGSDSTGGGGRFRAGALASFLAVRARYKLRSVTFKQLVLARRGGGGVEGRVKKAYQVTGWVGGVREGAWR